MDLKGIMSRTGDGYDFTLVWCDENFGADISFPPFFMCLSFVWRSLYYTFLSPFGVVCIATSFGYIQVMYGLSGMS